MRTTPSKSLSSSRCRSDSKFLHPTATLVIWRGDMAEPRPDWREASKALADEAARHRKAEEGEEAHGVGDHRHEHRRGDRRVLVESLEQDRNHDAGEAGDGDVDQHGGGDDAAQGRVGEDKAGAEADQDGRSEEHKSELQSLMGNSYA